MYRTLLVMALLLATQTCVSQSRKKALDDGMLDRVTAAGVTTTVSPGGVINFTGEVPTANGLVSGAGSLVIEAPGSSTTGSINLSGNAQQNLSSLININAVNSTINVLLNLNININSTVGTILQSNLNGKQH